MGGGGGGGQVNFQRGDVDVGFVLRSIGFNSASSPKQQSTDKHIAPLGHIILIPSQPAFGLSP